MNVIRIITRCRAQNGVSCLGIPVDKKAIMLPAHTAGVTVSQARWRGFGFPEHARRPWRTPTLEKQTGVVCGTCFEYNSAHAILSHSYTTIRYSVLREKRSILFCSTREVFLRNTTLDAWDTPEPPAVVGEGPRDLTKVSELTGSLFDSDSSFTH